MGGLAELERLRVDMADLRSGMDDLGLLSGGEAETDDGAEGLSDIVRGEGEGKEGRTGEGEREPG